MDPHANLKEQLEIAARIEAARDERNDVDRLAELVLALDAWRKGGGFDPYGGLDPWSWPHVSEPNPNPLTDTHEVEVPAANVPDAMREQLRRRELARDIAERDSHPNGPWLYVVVVKQDGTIGGRTPFFASVAAIDGGEGGMQSAHEEWGASPYEAARDALAGVMPDVDELEDAWRHARREVQREELRLEVIEWMSKEQIVAWLRRPGADKALLFKEPFDLPAGYVLVQYEDGFTCGIDREGRVSS